MPASNKHCLSTGNEFFTVNDIRTDTGGMGSLAFLYELARGTLVLTGGDKDLLSIELSIDGEQITLDDMEWTRLGYWVPQFGMQTSAGVFQATYLTPISRRGCILRLEFHAKKKAAITMSALLHWAGTMHVSHSARPVHGERLGGLAADGSGGLVFEFISGWPRFGLAVAAECEAEYSLETSDYTWSKQAPQLGSVRAQDVVNGAIRRTADVEAGQIFTLTLHLGLGAELRSALAISQELRGEGFATLMASTMKWLSDREIRTTGEASHLGNIINSNTLHNYFESCGVAVDTERLIVTSARNSRNPSNATYSDRDACLYSIPSVLMADPNQARRMLSYAFAVQMRHPGAMCKYMDGVPLQPGFALDAAVAPLRALWMYVNLTEDPTILFNQPVQAGLNRVIEILETSSGEDVALFSTRFTPGGDTARLPYVTYSNILAWRALTDLSDLYHRIRDVERQHETASWAREVQGAVYDHCIVDGPHGPMFCYSTDLKGSTELGDDPAGSLILAAHLEFCKESFIPYQNTCRWINERNEQSGLDRSSLLVIANQLLANNQQALNQLVANNSSEAPLLDDSQLCAHQADWGGGAGYISYSLVRAFEKHVEPPVLRPPERRRSRITRPDVRLGVGWI